MNNITEYMKYITTFDSDNEVSVDLCHSVFLFGTILSAKPESVLELGIGNGYLTKCILYALKYNVSGTLTTVDNFHDNNPAMSKIIDEVSLLGARVIAPVTEKEFVYAAIENAYDVVVSDADHHHSGEWTDEIFRITKPDGLIFVHDLGYYDSPKRYIEEAHRLNKPYVFFNNKTRPEETCENGWLMIRNTK